MTKVKITWKFFVVHLVYIFLLASTLYGVEHYQRKGIDVFEFYLTFYCTFFCWFGSMFITLLCVNIFKKLEQTLIRTIVNVILVLVFIYIVVWVGFIIFRDFVDDSFWEVYLTCTVITVFISSVYLTIDYFKLYKEKVEETEELKRLQIENEVKILSNQVNPHFLFNSLNTLMAIIPVDTKKAVHFTECFSKVYRYVLKNRNTETVTLGDEIELIRDYCYLLNIRFGENFKYTIDIPKHYLAAIIPPFVVQLLVENAAKHNTISQKEPLLLELYIEEEALVVKNNMNKKVDENGGTGAGLENIRKRVNHLTGKRMVIDNSAQYFKVVVPLIFAEAYESHHS